jgi:hypothetical protein
MRNGERRRGNFFILYKKRTNVSFLFIIVGNKPGVVPEVRGPDTKIRAFDCSKHGY